MCTRKVDEDEWVVKAKPRLVAWGFKQCKGLDSSETFVSTVSSFCVRLLSAIACECDVNICHFDVNQAFVQSDLAEDFFYDCRKDVVTFQSRKIVRLTD